MKVKLRFLAQSTRIQGVAKRSSSPRPQVMTLQRFWWGSYTVGLTVLAAKAVDSNAAPHHFQLVIGVPVEGSQVYCGRCEQKIYWKKHALLEDLLRLVWLLFSTECKYRSSWTMKSTRSQYKLVAEKDSTKSRMDFTHYINVNSSSFRPVFESDFRLRSRPARLDYIQLYELGQLIHSNAWWAYEGNICSRWRPYEVLT